MSDDNDGNNNKTGIYRGCYKKAQSVISVCDYLKEELNDGNVTDCVSCGEDRCNVHQVGGGAAGVSFSVMLLIINLAFFLIAF